MATEKRQIDANALSNNIHGISKNMKRPGAVELACLLMIAEAPTVDAVEVVRCKDCKHRDEAGCCTPPIISSYGWDHLEPKDNDYCSYGERRSDV